MKVHFGIIVPQEGESYERIREIAIKAEDLSFNSFWINDHLYLSKQDWPESISVIAALCEATKTIRLGTLVLSNTFRYPPVLAKVIATLDVISRGRMIFGIGAGWYDKEHSAYGIPFPKDSIRIEQLKEAVKLIKEMWLREKASFKGRFYSINDAVCNPKPVQKPHPPILIGGCGSCLLKVVAEEADMCNFGGPLAPQGSPLDFSYMLEKLRQQCYKVNRNLNTIEKTHTTHIIVGKNKEEIKRRSLSHLKSLISANRLVYAMSNFKRATTYLMSILSPSQNKPGIIGTPDDAIKKIEAYTNVGVEHFILRFPIKETIETMKLFSSEVMPCFV